MFIEKMHEQTILPVKCPRSTTFFTRMFRPNRMHPHLVLFQVILSRKRCSTKTADELLLLTSYRLADLQVAPHTRRRQFDEAVRTFFLDLLMLFDVSPTMEETDF